MWAKTKIWGAVTHQKKKTASVKPLLEGFILMCCPFYYQCLDISVTLMLQTYLGPSLSKEGNHDLHPRETQIQANFALFPRTCIRIEVTKLRAEQFLLNGTVFLCQHSLSREQIKK